MNEDEHNDERFELHLAVSDNGVSAVDTLAGQCTLSKRRIKDAMSAGAVWLEHEHGIDRIRRSSKQLKVGERLHLYYDENILSQEPAAADLVSDEGDYTVWNKPCGMFSEGSRWGDHCTITRWAEQHTDPQRNAWLVHRLDRATNGLILIAHNRKTAKTLSAMFAAREIEKRYRASVEGELDIETPLHITTDVDGKSAETIINTAQTDNDDHCTRVECRIITGRKHQVRSHLASLGHPVIGDRLFGSKRLDKDLQLTSCYLGFTCPVSGTAKEFTL